MKRLTIKPTDTNNDITFGKIPLFSRNPLALFERAHKVVQIRTSGRYYAIETVPEIEHPLNEAVQKLSSDGQQHYTYGFTTAEPEKKKEEKPTPTPPVKEKKLSKDLEDLGFVNISEPKKKNEAKRPAVHDTTPAKQGNLSLFEWLKSTDYVIYNLFIYGNGQVNTNRVVKYDEILKLFLDAGLEDSSGKELKEIGGRAAQNVTNATICRLLVMKILQKDESLGRKGKAQYTLTMPRGTQYARDLCRVVTDGEYHVDKYGRRRVKI